jgi:hypothetical protein
MPRRYRALVASIATLVALGTHAQAARADERATSAGESSPPPGVPAPPSMSSGFMLGASVGYMTPLLGDLNLGGGPGPGAGVSVGVTGGYRWHWLYLGATYSHGFLAGNGTTGHESTYWYASSATSDYVGVDFVTISDPVATVAFITHLGAGYRVVQTTATSSYDSTPFTSTNASPDFVAVGIGLHVKAEGWLRIQPEASISIGAGLFATIGLTTYFDLGGTPAK